jgi:hypothetical protein
MASASMSMGLSRSAFSAQAGMLNKLNPEARRPMMRRVFIWGMNLAGNGF